MRCRLRLTHSVSISPRARFDARKISPLHSRLSKAKQTHSMLWKNSLVSANSAQIVELTLHDRLPTVFYTRDVVLAGGLFSYGPSYPALFQRAADFVDKILRGTKPDDIPVEQPAKFELVINLKTAKLLGLDVPHNLLVLADDVIE